MATEDQEHEIYNEDRNLRVVQVYPHPSQLVDTTIDIFAIHGLDTTSQKTWIWKNKEHNVNWLKDENMLPHELPNARIFTCDWPSKLYRAVDSSEMAIPDLARGLLLDIQSMRREKKAAKDRPLAFIASCLGGIVLAHAITIAKQPGSDYADLGNAISGILFLATPFRGTSLAECFQVAVWRLSVTGFFRGETLSKGLLNNVGESQSYLENLVREFTRSWTAGGAKQPVYCFYETKTTDLLKKGLPQPLAKLFANPKRLVDPSSASLDIAESIELDATHVTMNKFKGPDDNNYRRVVEKVMQICRDAPIPEIQPISSETTVELCLEATNAFKDSLPPVIREQFEEFDDSQNMLSSIQATSSSNPRDESRLASSRQRLKSFLDALEPYFQVAEVVFSIDTPMKTTLLSSIALIFKLSVNYINFAEQVTGMFSDIADELSSYQALMAMICDPEEEPSLPYSVLAMPMALLYIDILRVYRTICGLFTGNQGAIGGRRYTRSLVDFPVWKPIDLQHKDMIARLRLHDSLLRAFTEQASDEEVFRLKNAVEKSVRIDQIWTDRERAEEDRNITVRVGKTLRWMSAPAWSNRFEDARKSRTPGTCKWILENSGFQNWRDTKGGSLSSRILHIQAKPGYGKTFLCSSIIENLGDFALTTDSRGTRGTNLVLFYFFDKRSGFPNSPTDALKAILAQLMVLRRWDKQLVDIVSLILNTESTASPGDDEIDSVLELLLDQLKFIYIVFDGLDECLVPSILLSRIKSIASRTQTTAILFLGRPSIELPYDMRKDRPSIFPSPEENTVDIRKFLGTQFSDVIQEKLDPEQEEQQYNAIEKAELKPDEKPPAPVTNNLGIDIERSTTEIVKRANGMFLWVKLLLEYLRLPSLTLQDVKDAVENLNLLQGLDSIYGTILGSLEARFNQVSLKNICRLFQLVVYSKRQLMYDELLHAVSMPIDRRWTQSDTIPRFRTSIGPLSGSLLEVSKYETVQFVHLSAQEYFVQSSLSEEKLTASKILANQALASRNIAAICLSYLVHTIPPKPLQTNGQLPANRTSIRNLYPLLRYSAQYWSAHFYESFISGPGKLEDAQCGDATWLQVGHLIRNFLMNEKKIMVWIQASWLELTPPEIHAVPSAESIRHIIGVNHKESSELLGATSRDLEELSIDLINLAASWSYILIREPHEIWGPSIACFNPSRFWMKAKDARVIRAPLSNLPSDNTITIRSKISKDGKECGVIKLIPPESWLKPTPRAYYSIPKGWKARYEIWSLELNQITHNIEISLSDKTMEPFVYMHVRFCRRGIDEKDETPSLSEADRNHWKRKHFVEDLSPTLLRSRSKSRNHNHGEAGESSDEKEDNYEGVGSVASVSNDSSDGENLSEEEQVLDSSLEDLLLEPSETRNPSLSRKYDDPEDFLGELAQQTLEATTREEKKNLQELLENLKNRKLKVTDSWDPEENEEEEKEHSQGFGTRPPPHSDFDLQRFRELLVNLPDRTRRELTGGSGGVALPVEISDDLHRVLILDTVIVLQSESNTEEGEQNLPKLDALEYQVLDINSQDCFIELRTDLGEVRLFEMEDFYHAKFSLSTEFLVVVRESLVKANKGSHKYGILWLLQIFRDETFGTALPPQYECILTTRFFSVPEVSILSPIRGIALHPTLPRLAFPQTVDGLPQTYIWDFDRPVVLADVDEETDSELNPFPISDPPILDPIFSDNGQYLYGTDSPIEFGNGYISSSNLRALGRAIVIEVPSYTPPEPSRAEEEETKLSGKMPAKDQSLIPFSSAALGLALRPNIAIQRANVLAFDVDKGGVVHVSQMQQMEKEGKVVLNSLGTDGKLSSQTLSRFPKEITHCVDVSLLHPNSGTASDSHRIVLDKAPQRVYTFSDVNRNVLPAILDRKKASIKNVFKTIEMDLASEGIFPRQIGR